MNAHDSEKVVGTLLSEGYSQVETPRRRRVSCSTTRAASATRREQKVFNRLQNFKREAGKGKIFGVLGCVAQQEGEKIFDRAPHVSPGGRFGQLHPAGRNAGAARSRQPPRHRPRASTPTKAFDTPFTRRDNPHRAYITIIEGCDKSCAYCVVPFTRGPERSRTSQSVMAEAGGLAEQGYTEVQLLGQNVNSYRDPSPAGWDFATLARPRGRNPRHAPRALHHQPSARFRARHRRRHGRQPGHLRSRPPAGAVRLLARARRHGPPLHARRIHAPHRVDQECEAPAIPSPPTSSSASPARPITISSRPSTCWMKCSTIRSSASNTRRAPTPPRSSMEDRIPEDEKQRRSADRCRRSSAPSRSGATPSSIGSIQEVLVEGRNQALGQWIGRTSCNRTLNFTHPDTGGDRSGRQLPLRPRYPRRSQLAGGRECYGVV